VKKIGQRKVSKCIFYDAARWVQILSEIKFLINFKFISNLFLKEDGFPYLEDIENNPQNCKIMKIIVEHKKTLTPLCAVIHSSPSYKEYIERRHGKHLKFLLSF